MSVETVKSRLAELERTITGVTAAYGAAPASLPDTELPAFVNFTGEATYSLRAQGAETNVETRLYRLRLYVAHVQEGIDGEAETRCDPFFERVRAFFDSHSKLDNLRWVRQASLISDSGAAVLRFANDAYIGIEFRLQVVEEIDVSYADEE